jgi:hypothetical protein
VPCPRHKLGVKEGQTDLLSLRTGLNCEDDHTMYFHHKTNLLVVYPKLQRKCYDLFNKTQETRINDECDSIAGPAASNGKPDSQGIHDIV